MHSGPVRLTALFCSLVWLASGAAPAGAAAPAVAIHQLQWFVHADLITGPRQLSFYQKLIAQATVDAESLVKGNQGPVDSPCCAGFEAVSVSTFGAGSPNLLTIDSQAELDALDLVGGPGAHAFIVQALNFCAGPGNPIGCADTPACGSEPADQVLVISMEAHDDFDSFASTLAHERGHNTCLVHVATHTCDLMRPAAGGGCLSATECAEFREDAQLSSGSCSCYASAASYQPDATSCAEVAGGLCSGGLCGSPAGDAGAMLFAAGATDAIENGFPDDPMRISGATGGWTDLGTFPGGLALEGLAYAPGRGVLYGVAPGAAGATLLLDVDASTGAATTLAPVTGIDAGSTVLSLAWDPGPTAASGDDQLYAIDLQADLASGSLYSIDPDTGAGVKLGPLNFSISGGLSGLAYDPVNRRLYASWPAVGSGLAVVDTVCSSQCSVTNIVDPGSLAQTTKFESGLAYSAATARIFHVGSQTGPRIEFDSYDAGDLAGGLITKAATRGLDGFTTGGLAALPAPEPGPAPGAAAALATLAALGAARAARRRRAPGAPESAIR